MLASDSDREKVVTRLRTSHLQGVLGADTYERRIDATLRATRRAELRAIVSDLPSPRETLRDAFVSLLGTAGHLGARQIVLPGWTEPPLVVGRSRSCDITLADDTVSARHAEIRPLVERDAWLLVDLWLAERHLVSKSTDRTHHRPVRRRDAHRSHHTDPRRALSQAGDPDPAASR